MRQYLELCKKIIDEGTFKEDRTNTGTLSYFGYQMRFNLKEGFPLLTTKRVHLKSIIHELLCFISGDTNIKYLVDNDVRIWNDWPYLSYRNSQQYQGETIEEFADKIKKSALFSKQWGDLGPIYGKQWRDFLGVDQLKNLVEEIKNNANSRRLIISAWNPLEVFAMALPPCHCLCQFYVCDCKLSCQLYQRSGDVFLGVPFNIACYTLLTMMIAQVTGLELGEFIHTLGDAHIYINHLEQIKVQLTRIPRPLPKIILNTEVKSIFDFKYEDFKLINYNPYNGLKGKVAV